MFEDVCGTFCWSECTLFEFDDTFTVGSIGFGLFGFKDDCDGAVTLGSNPLSAKFVLWGEGGVGGVRGVGGTGGTGGVGGVFVLITQLLLKFR